MSDSFITLQGWVGSEVETREVGGHVVASFRVGSTPRQRRNGNWVDGETSWYTVNCWRALGQNVAESIHKGDPVIVRGRVRVDVWAREGQEPSTSWLVEAMFVGHDLNRGTSSFVRQQRSTAVPMEDEGVRELVHSYGPDGPRLDSDGREVEPAA